MLQTSCDAENYAPILNSKSFLNKCDAFTIEESEESDFCDNCREGSDDVNDDVTERELLGDNENEILSDFYMI